MRDYLALWLIRVAKRLTSFGDTYDYLVLAESSQKFWNDYVE